MSRAVLQGVAHSVRALLKRVLDVEPSAVRPSELVVCGGVTKSEVWMQILADVMGLPLAVAPDAENAGARGAALLAGQRSGLGWFDSLNGPPGFAPRGRVFMPRADGPTRELIERQHALHLKLHAALRETFKGLAEASAEYARAQAAAAR
jgi:sugar (pentulose or hexulose) kinase